MKLFCLFFIVLTSALFGEKAESKCALECRKKGYQYHYCEAKCAGVSGHNEIDDKDKTHSPPNKETDSKCSTDCLKQGYQLGYCETKCSY